MNTLIHNYSPASDCLLCPFFKVVVANAGHGSSVKCLASGMEMGIDEIPYIKDKRAPNCPMEEVE